MRCTGCSCLTAQNTRPTERQQRREPLSEWSWDHEIRLKPSWLLTSPYCLLLPAIAHLPAMATEILLKQEEQQAKMLPAGLFFPHWSLVQARPGSNLLCDFG